MPLLYFRDLCSYYHVRGSDLSELLLFVDEQYGTGIIPCIPCIMMKSLWRFHFTNSTFSFLRAPPPHSPAFNALYHAGSITTIFSHTALLSSILLTFWECMNPVLTFSVVIRRESTTKSGAAESSLWREITMLLVLFELQAFRTGWGSVSGSVLVFIL